MKRKDYKQYEFHPSVWNYGEAKRLALHNYTHHEYKKHPPIKASVLHKAHPHG